MNCKGIKFSWSCPHWDWLKETDSAGERVGEGERGKERREEEEGGEGGRKGGEGSRARGEREREERLQSPP